MAPLKKARSGKNHLRERSELRKKALFDEGMADDRDTARRWSPKRADKGEPPLDASQRSSLDDLTCLLGALSALHGVLLDTAVVIQVFLFSPLPDA